MFTRLCSGSLRKQEQCLSDFKISLMGLGKLLNWPIEFHLVPVTLFCNEVSFALSESSQQLSSDYLRLLEHPDVFQLT